MGIEFISVIAAGLASLLTGLVASSGIFRKLLHQLTGKQEDSEKAYGVRLAELTASLTNASSEVDTILAELAQAAGNRESAVRKLEEDLQALETREKELQDTIDVLEQTPLPVAERFAELVEHAETRSRRRDYILFGAGVGVTSIIAIIIQLTAG